MSLFSICSLEVNQYILNKYGMLPHFKKDWCYLGPMKIVHFLLFHYALETNPRFKKEPEIFKKIAIEKHFYFLFNIVGFKRTSEVEYFFLPARFQIFSAADCLFCG